MTKTFWWQTTLCVAALALALLLVIRSDRSSLRWVSDLSMQGSPPPKRDTSSPTGYALGQRQFLGTRERGDTYRWIAATQDVLALGPFASPIYQADNVPTGRPQLMPRLYAWWLGAVSWVLHFFTGESTGLSAERTALWEPVISHVLALVAAVAFMARRYGAVSAVVTGFFFAWFAPLGGQFLPGVLTPRTWALLLAAYALALHIPARRDRRETPPFGLAAAIAASVSLWLDPALGFPVVVISAALGAIAILTRRSKGPYMQWALLGSAMTLGAWLLDRSPWDPAAGELRYVHPWYAFAWLGLGLVLDAWQRRRTAEGSRRGQIIEIVAGVALTAGLAYTQVQRSYPGWLYPSGSMRRLTSLDETTVFGTVLDWAAAVSPSDVLFVLGPLLLAIVALLAAFWRRREEGYAAVSLGSLGVLLVGITALAFFRIRWSVVVPLVALPLIWRLALPTPLLCRRILLFFAALFLFGFFQWGKELPLSLQRPAGKMPIGTADLQALIYRHFSHWMATHTPGEKVAALAPPELSDSLVFHGGCRVLTSTAWESYPGLVAASRILSSPESTEAEAVVQSRGITHIILPSWDTVLPLLARKPVGEDRDTLYARLQRWVCPPYLRAIPYHLPETPSDVGQKLAVFKVVPPQDEALSLGRLAEYFVEMDRGEPAALVAKVLAKSFPNDPNARIARATVYSYIGNQAEFAPELARLATDAAAGRSPFSWDRRVQRAILLAFGGRSDLARTEIEACVASASKEAVRDLTPLQAYRLRTLAIHFEIAFPDAELAQILASLGAEFSS